MGYLVNFVNLGFSSSKATLADEKVFSKKILKLLLNGRGTRRDANKPKNDDLAIFGTFDSVCLR